MYQRLNGWKRWRRSGLVFIPLATLAISTSALAQQVRTIQTPAPFNACHLRSAGGTQYGILGTFRDGTTVTLLGEFGRGWYRVQVQQEIGWMARQCLGL
ncbi:MAG: SH3 domain-containing protein [Leptolyngbyaceae cyanobacterium]